MQGIIGMLSFLVVPVLWCFVISKIHENRLAPGQVGDVIWEMYSRPLFSAFGFICFLLLLRLLKLKVEDLLYSVFAQTFFGAPYAWLWSCPSVWQAKQESMVCFRCSAWSDCVTAIHFLLAILSTSWFHVHLVYSRTAFCAFFARCAPRIFSNLRRINKPAQFDSPASTILKFL